MFRCSRKCVHYANRYECHNFHEQTLRTYPYFRDTCWKYTPAAIIKFVAFFIFHPFHIFNYLWWGGGAIYRSTPKPKKMPATEASWQPNMDRTISEPSPAAITEPASGPEPVAQSALAPGPAGMAPGTTGLPAADLMALELLKTEIINREQIKRLYPHQHELIRHNQNVIDELLLLLKTRNYDNQTVIRLIK